MFVHKFSFNLTQFIIQFLIFSLPLSHLFTILSSPSKYLIALSCCQNDGLMTQLQKVVMININFTVFFFKSPQLVTVSYHVFVMIMQSFLSFHLPSPPFLLLKIWQLFSYLRVNNVNTSTCAISVLSILKYSLEYYLEAAFFQSGLPFPVQNFAVINANFLQVQSPTTISMLFPISDTQNRWICNFVLPDDWK